MYRSLTALNHKVWFLWLMIFVIGWSGVSYAFAASQHLSQDSSAVASQHDLIPACHMHSKAQVDVGKNHLKSDLSNAHLAIDQHIEHLKHSVDHFEQAQVSQYDQSLRLNLYCQHDQATAVTHTTNMDVESIDHGLDHVQHQQHAKCHECSPLHCQSISSSLDTAVIVAFQPLSERQQYLQHSNYLAQHLLGHWQDILRPPKA